MEQRRKIPAGGLTEQLFHIVRTGRSRIGPVTVRRQLLQRGEEHAVAKHIPQRMHEKSSLAIDIRMIGILFGNILAEDNGLFILELRDHPLEMLLISRLSLHVPGIQRITKTTDPLVY